MCSVRGGAIVGFWICADLGRGRHCTALPKWRCNAKCAEGSEVHTHVLPSPVDFENMYMSLPDVVAHTTCVTCVVNGLLRLSLAGSSRFSTIHVLKILYHELVKAHGPVHFISHRTIFFSQNKSASVGFSATETINRIVIKTLTRQLQFVSSSFCCKWFQWLHATVLNRDTAVGFVRETEAVFVVLGNTQS
jgi:hypothetical protein